MSSHENNIELSFLSANLCYSFFPTVTCHNRIEALEYLELLHRLNILCLSSGDPVVIYKL